MRRRDRASCRLFASLALATCVCLSAGPARAEMYLWTDASGRVHMTDDLSQVPPSQRAQAERAAREASQERYQPQPDSLDDLRLRARTQESPERAAVRGPSPEAVRAFFGAVEEGAGRRHTLQVEQVGSSMRVQGVIDGVEIPFILDTGATTCTLPRWAVEALGLVIDEDTPRVPVSGISGKVLWVPELMVESVTVGSAQVENLHMTVLDSMDEGLLGMPFFNHFRASTDPVAGTLVLEEIDLDRVPGMVGGLNERAWRQKFGQRRYALEQVRRRLEELPYEYITIRERLEQQERYWEAQLEQLDLEATRLGVPQSWRD